jgi:sterol desaturase/sphingolipid hydroxylase (fatty acid hydroxylase superfamily)
MCAARLEQGIGVMGEFFERLVALLLPDPQTLWFLAFWGLLAAFAWLESAVPAFQAPPNRNRRWPTNFGLAIINVVLVTLVPLSAVIAAQWAKENGIGLLNMAGGSWWIALAATVVIRSLAGYALHVLLHKVRLLWPMHRVHHSDTHLDVSTTIRTHPLELVFQFLTLVPLAVAFGLNPWALIAYEVIDGFVSLASHANVRLPDRLDRVLRWLFVTPNMHCLHHSSYQPETDSNYGQVFSVWDRLFGTYSAAPRDGYDAMQIGLNEIGDERAADFVWQLKSPALGTIRNAERGAPDNR